MTNVKEWMGTGITTEAFMDWMPKNQDTFKASYNGFSMEEADQSFFEGYKNDNLHCMVIASDWCGDVVRNAPVVFRVMEYAGIPTEVFILEEHDELIQPFLLYGGKSIPVVLLVNEQGEVLHRWGPRPDYIQQPMAEFKALNLDRETDEYKEKIKEVYAEIFRRYGEGTGYYSYIIQEFKEILKKIK